MERWEGYFEGTLPGRILVGLMTPELRTSRTKSPFSQGTGQSTEKF